MKKKSKPAVYIMGASGFSMEVSEYIKDNSDFEIAGYFDNSKVAVSDYYTPFLGEEDDYNFSEGENVVISIADPKIRNSIYGKLKSKKLNFPSIVHKTCYVSPLAKIGEGAILCPFVSVTANAEIGKNFQANIYSYVAHDCVIGDNVTFAPSVKCNGNVIIEDNVYIGTGAIIFQGKPGKPLVIGKNSVIAAGSVVIKSVDAGMTVFGNPAIEFTRENIQKRS